MGRTRQRDRLGALGKLAEGGSLQPKHADRSASTSPRDIFGELEPRLPQSSVSRLPNELPRAASASHAWPDSHRTTATHAASVLIRRGGGHRSLATECRLFNPARRWSCRFGHGRRVRGWLYSGAVPSPWLSH